MQIQTIEDEVASFTDRYFSDSLDLIDTTFEFIDAHSLYEPKKSYFFCLHFLQTTMNNFTNLDYEFASPTLKKLHRDIHNLHKIYTNQDKEILETVFEKKFFPSLSLFKEMQAEILHIQAQPMEEEDKEDIQIIQGHTKAMKAIYLTCFKEDYLEQKNSLLESLKNILNTKLYYFDKLLWRDASDSKAITRVHKNLKEDEDLSALVYIEHRLSVDIPYTDNFKYLQKCLKVYR